MFKLLLVLTFLTSCVSMSADWSSWKVEDVAYDKRIWRFCSREKDGEELHRKGFCYVSQECRTRKTILGNEKSECRQLPLFCAWGDIECMDRYNIFNKVIVHKEKLR